MLALGAGNLEVALASQGKPHYLVVPKVVGVNLRGTLPDGRTVHDLALEVLKRVTQRGGDGRIFEFCGQGIVSLNVWDRITLAGLSGLWGAATAVFPSDAQTRSYLAAQGRGGGWRALSADRDAVYDEFIEIDLSQLESFVAKPLDGFEVRRLSEVAGTRVNEVVLGGCGPIPLHGLMGMADRLEHRGIHPEVSVWWLPSSRQVLSWMAIQGGLAKLVRAGVRIVEPAASFCNVDRLPMESAAGVSVRTCCSGIAPNGNGRGKLVYLAGVEAAVSCALEGALGITEGRGAVMAQGGGRAAEAFDFRYERLLLAPKKAGRPGPGGGTQRKKSLLSSLAALPRLLQGEVLLKGGEDLGRGRIWPSSVSIFSVWEDRKALARFLFEGLDGEFPDRALRLGGGWIVAGHRFGCGTVREQSAIACRLLGIRGVLARSFDRLMADHLANFGILPLVFGHDKDYELLRVGDLLEVPIEGALEGEGFVVWNRTQNSRFTAQCRLSRWQRQVVRAGGLLSWLESTGDARPSSRKDQKKQKGAKKRPLSKKRSSPPKRKSKKPRKK
jgi:aconitate hydratase